MIALHPHPEMCLKCPLCHVTLAVNGWLIPGMRTLADLTCPQCRRAFFGDLPVGHGLLYPILLDRADGTTYDVNGGEWFRERLRDSYAHQTDTPVGFGAQEFRPLRSPVLLNCLDSLYGHCLLKLLNAQYYIDHRPDLDLIVLVPSFLRWLVPEGTAAVWTVDLPLNQGAEWNNWLAQEIRRRIEPLGRCHISVALSHPHPSDFQIERFTRVAPFPLEDWQTRHSRPIITFIWRNDRPWDRLIPPTRLRVRAMRRIMRSLGLSALPAQRQKRNVVALARTLRRAAPQTDFAVAGWGMPGGLPAWITDLRTTSMTEEKERDLCRRYAESHVVIGVHGSNMLLPSAHAGAVLELLTEDRRGNLGQDILANARSPQEALTRCQFLPHTAPPSAVANAALSLLDNLPFALLNFTRPWNDHRSVETAPCSVTAKYREIKNELNNARPGH